MAEVALGENISVISELYRGLISHISLVKRTKSNYAPHLVSCDYVQNRAKKDLEQKTDTKNKCLCFLKRREPIPQKTEWGTESERETTGSWVIGFVLCGFSTWPPSPYLPFIKKAYN